MAGATPAHSDSESERVPSKKQKKGEDSPVDDPMDEDGGDEEEAEGNEEYEIEAIMDSSMDIFKDVCPPLVSGSPTQPEHSHRKWDTT